MDTQITLAHLQRFSRALNTPFLDVKSGAPSAITLRTVYSQRLDEKLTAAYHDLGYLKVETAKMSGHVNAIRREILRALEVYVRKEQIDFTITGSCEAIIAVATALLHLPFMTFGAIVADAKQWADRYVAGLAVVSRQS